VNERWWIGPSQSHEPGRLVLPAHAIDLDTVHELRSAVSEATGNARLVLAWNNMKDPDEEITTGLDNQPDWVLRKIAIAAENGEMRVFLGEDHPTVIAYGNLKLGPAAEKVASIIKAQGEPRIDWSQATTIPSRVITLATVGCWIWFLFSQSRLSLAVAGSLLIWSAVLATWPLPWLFSRLMPATYGHQIRSMSRQETRRRRADRHADLRVALITIPAGAALGAIAQALLS
jgi:hypothetical protein